jgi:hypothetical protein
MQAKRYLELTALMVIAVLATVMLVSAQSYTYQATSTSHGDYLPVDTPVTVQATTNAPSTLVTYATFIWKNADGVIQFNDPPNVVPVVNGYAENTHTPNTPGDWGVQVFFQGPNGPINAQDITEIVKIRATSFFVTPEYAFGGLLALGACFAGLVAFKKRNSLPHLKSKP